MQGVLGAAIVRPPHFRKDVWPLRVRVSLFAVVTISGVVGKRSNEVRDKRMARGRRHKGVRHRFRVFVPVAASRETQTCWAVWARVGQVVGSVGAWEEGMSHRG